MKNSPYPFAPLKPREIPQMLTTAAFEHGVDMFAAISRGNQTAASDHGSHELKRRLEADIQQLELGPLSAVTR